VTQPKQVLYLVKDGKKFAELDIFEGPIPRVGEYIYGEDHDGLRGFKIENIAHFDHLSIATVVPENCPNFPYEGLTELEIVQKYGNKKDRAKYGTR